MLNRLPFVMLFFSLSFLALIGFKANYRLPSSKKLNAYEQLSNNSIQFAFNDKLITYNTIQIGMNCTENTSILSIWFGEKRQNRISFIVKGKLEPSEYYLDEPMVQFASVQLDSETFSTDEFYSGKLSVSSYDSLTGQLTGTFDFSATNSGTNKIVSIKSGAFKLSTNNSSL